MKYTSILLVLAVNSLYAQEYVKGIVNFQSKNKAFIEKLYQQASPNQKATTDVTIQRLFSKNRLVKIMPTYEGTKDEYLKDFHTLYFEGDHDEFMGNSKEIRKSKLVDSVFQVRKAISTFTPSDAMYITPTTDWWLWNLGNIRASEAWDITTGSTGVTIAVVDEGFDTNHPDLNGKINLADPKTGSVLKNADSHGTATAVDAAGITNGGGAMASIGFNTNLIGYLDEGIGVSKAHHASLVGGAKVVSISWYNSCSLGAVSQADRNAIKEILDNGTVIVASAGNNTNNCGGAEIFPFANSVDSRVIKVTSISSNNNHETSSHYPQVDICAPGNRVGTAINTTDASGNPVAYPYILGWGTSLSTPIVAGVVGLMFAANPCLTPVQVEDIIKRTANPVNNAADYPGLIGAGRIDAYKAVKEAVTRYIQNTTVSSSTTTQRAFVDIGSNVTATLPAGPVKSLNGTIWNINARK